jgi:hypothetical protein
MKKLIFTACVALMAGNGVAQTFEGRIAMSTVNTLNDEKAEVSWLLRKGESRMDFVSVAKGVSTDYALIVDAIGIDMVAKGQVTKVPTNAIPAGNYQLMERAGEETVNGFNCTHYVFTDGSSRIDIWASTEVGVSLSDMPFLMRAKFPAGDQFKGFPIRFEKRDLMGKLLQSHDVRSIQAEAVPASAFVRK